MRGFQFRKHCFVVCVSVRQTFCLTLEEEFAAVRGSMRKQEVTPWWFMLCMDSVPHV